MNFWISRQWASGSDEINIRPSKSSGLTSFAICSKSRGDRISAFGNFMPPFGQGVLHRLLIGGGPGKMQLEDLGHRARILVGLEGAFYESFEDGLDLLLRSAHRNQPIAELSGFLGRQRAGGGHVDWRRLLGHGPQPDRL